MNFKPFPKIGQFREVVKRVTERSKYHGVPLPTLTFEGTVKIHGTNAAIGLDSQGNLWAQSRNNIITPENDNAGFAAWVDSNREELFKSLQCILVSDPCIESVIVYGEWCGQGIQKGVAVSQLPKMFVVFDLVAVGLKTSDAFDLNLFQTTVPNVYLIKDFPRFTKTIDFNNPQSSVNDMIAITEKVEECCPVGKHFGVTGIGEGVVWRCTTVPDLIFKVKGEKHSVTKVKKLASVDTEKMNSIAEFVEYACTENRLKQGLENVELDIKNVGKFIGWISKDIWGEEKDTLENNGLTMKDVASQLANKSRKFFMEQL